MICPQCQHVNEEGVAVCGRCRAPLPAPPPDLDFERDREKIDGAFAHKYDTLRLIGSGGFAAVYLARDKLLEREVAVKILLPQHIRDSQTVERFIREARLYARLEHPNIIPIYDVRIAGTDVFLIMKCVRGESLKSLLQRQGRLQPAQIAKIIAGLASALDYIHRRGIVHRDIKPGNILVEEVGGAVYLADFGIARADSSRTLTQSGMIVGTPHYLAPEQIKGEKSDSRSDIYALGASLYEMAAGIPPFRGENPLDHRRIFLFPRRGEFPHRTPNLASYPYRYHISGLLALSIAVKSREKIAP